MRAIFGLVGLLVFCGIIAWFWGHGGHPADVVNQARPAQEAAEKLNPKALMESATFQVTKAGGGDALLVTSVNSPGRWSDEFGLKINDVVVGIYQPNTTPSPNPELMSPEVINQYAAQGWRLLVDRPGVGRITLPMAAAAPTIPGVTPPANPAPGTPANPTPATPANPPQGFDPMRPLRDLPTR